MSETPPPKTNEEIVEPLLSHLGASLSELWLLPPAFLEESVSDLRLAPPAAARLLIALAASGHHHWVLMLVTLSPYYVGWGLAQPMATAIAMRPFPQMAGQASAWLGIAQQVGGMGFAIVAAQLGGGIVTLVVMAVAAVAFTAVVLPAERVAA